MEETFGQINTESFDNELYSKFYFVNKDEAERTVHSRAMENYIAVLKHKHNSYRKDYRDNTTFFINSSLNKELDLFSSLTGNTSL